MISVFASHPFLLLGTRPQRARTDRSRREMSIESQPDLFLPVYHGTRQALNWGQVLLPPAPRSISTEQPRS